MAAGRVLAAMAVCLVLWALLDAQALRRSAEASPLGARRSAALAVLRPLSRLSSLLSIDRVGRLVDRALGRNPDAPPGGSDTGALGPGPAVGPAAPSIPAPLPSSPKGTTRSVGSAGPGGASTSNGRPGPASPAASLPPLRRPSVANPLRILVVGDSLAADLGVGLERTLDPKLFSIAVDGRQSTGLARADYFNWPAALSRDVARYRPELVVAMFGANDNQSVALGGGRYAYVWNRPAWQSAYAGRVSQAMAEATARGARLVWVGLPVTQSSVIPPDRAGVLNGIYGAEAAGHRGVLYFDSWHLFVNGKGRYAAFLPDARGNIQLMRQPDHVHLTLAGNDFLARSVVSALTRTWGLRA